jgi:xanthine dehydrogenase accessory factor
MRFSPWPVLIRGGGDLASGVAYRLVKAGFPVMITELAQPLAIRRTVTFASAIYEGQVTVDGLTARRVETAAEAQVVLVMGEIPVLVDDAGTRIKELNPAVVVDARLAKHNLDTTLQDARLVIALGPGFEAGKDCHAVIETNRGHHLGRVIWQGSAEPNTGRPGEIKGHVSDRVLRAPATGQVVPYAQIGDDVRQGDRVAAVAGLPMQAPFDGMLRGLIHPSVIVPAGMKIGDVDPRGKRDYCFTISDKSLAIGGGVVEAVLSAPQFA